MVTPVEGSWVVGSGHQDVKDLLQGIGAGGTTLWVGNVDDILTHWEDAGWLSPPGDMPNDRAADDTEGGWEFGQPTFGGGGGGCSFGGGIYICILPI